MFCERDIVSVINEFATPVYVGQGKVARLSETQLFTEAPVRLKRYTDVWEKDQLREIIRAELDKLGITERTHISFRDPQNLDAGRSKLTFVYLGFLHK